MLEKQDHRQSGGEVESMGRGSCLVEEDLKEHKLESGKVDVGWAGDDLK